MKEFSDDEEERRVKRAENAKRKAASGETSDGDVVAIESDNRRQGGFIDRGEGAPVSRFVRIDIITSTLYTCESCRGQEPSRTLASESGPR